MKNQQKISLFEKSLAKNEENDEREIVLPHKAAMAASPEDSAVCGEEDPGASLESLVTVDFHEKKTDQHSGGQ